MDKYVAIYVTSTQNGGEPISEREHNATVAVICRKFVEVFGGCTKTQGTGFWQSDTKGLIEEPVTIVKAYHTLENSEALAVVIPLARDIKTLFNQEAVSVETERGLEFI